VGRLLSSEGNCLRVLDFCQRIREEKLIVVPFLLYSRLYNLHYDTKERPKMIK